MKKTLLTALLTATACIGMHAQSNPESGLGVQVNWDYSVPATNLTGLDSGSGVSGGFIYDVPVWRSLYVEPGVSFYYDTMDLDYFDLFINGKNIGVDGTMRNYGFRIPLMAGYKIDLVDDIAISVIAGPQLNVGLGNKMHYDVKGIADVDLYDNGWRKCDLQVKFGMKFHYLDNFYAEITGALGVTNMIDGNKFGDSHVRRNSVSLGVGYKF